MSKLTTTHSHRSKTPVTFVHAHRVADMDPMWGLYASVRVGALDPVRFDLPPVEVLKAMQGELADALIPCTMEEAAVAAGVLIESYPQKDNTGAIYAEQVAMRLAECPADLLSKVVTALIDDNLDWRPAPGRVKAAVAAVISKRKRLGDCVAAALRYHQHQAAEKARMDRVAFDKATAQGTPKEWAVAFMHKMERDATDGREADGTPPAVGILPPPAKPRLPDVRLTGDALAQARARLPAK